MKNERLPFTVRPVRDRRDLDRAVQTRHQAYQRHVPILAATLKTAEPMDHSAGVVVLLAESKLDGSILGTMRIHTNEYGALPTERSVQLPAQFAHKRLAEATRLGVVTGTVGTVVKAALFKAFFRYCKRVDIDDMVIAGRAPLDRMYERLLFEEVFPGQGFVNLPHTGNLPHRIMFLNLHTAEARWALSKHRWFDYYIRTTHPDLDFDLVKMPVITEAEVTAVGQVSSNSTNLNMDVLLSASAYAGQSGQGGNRATH